MRQEVFILHPKDNVATLISDRGKAGTTFGEITLRADVPFGHKFAIRPIAKGSQVIKYGYSIGTASMDIAPGDYVHLHNLESNRGRGDLAAAKGAR